MFNAIQFLSVNALAFEPMEFVYNLKYMGVGMIGVFMIIGVIMLATYVIGKLTGKKN